MNTLLSPIRYVQGYQQAAWNLINCKRGSYACPPWGKKEMRWRERGRNLQQSFVIKKSSSLCMNSGSGPPCLSSLAPLVIQIPTHSWILSWNPTLIRILSGGVWAKRIKQFKQEWPNSLVLWTTALSYYSFMSSLRPFHGRAGVVSVQTH